MVLVFTNHEFWGDQDLTGPTPMTYIDRYLLLLIVQGHMCAPQSHLLPSTSFSELHPGRFLLVPDHVSSCFSALQLYSFPSLYNGASKSVADVLLPIPTLVEMWLHPKDCLRPLWSTLLHSITFCTITPLIFSCGVSFSARLTYLTACLLPVCILEYDLF